MVADTSAPPEIPTALRPLETTNMRQGDICSFQVDSQKVTTFLGLVSQRGAVQTVLPPVHSVAPLASLQGR